ncbi:NADPH-dependent F420 reductase [Pontibacter chinhatensis]|uniref:Pyrroline-5-carboxylate reductase catalytic N-terminal domain-containing protein n=1 Tax=Pontibacter chinhatensis TaxID=1436961 RepID=A0A1I2X505_9BACT|nr:NAD(P)-binding domain-containing protein [Pontibacter chinhatensis]SFH08588.1 hypothetical protein SAMN05421739_105388 [Pontibacter chinhatensis]
MITKQTITIVGASGSMGTAISSSLSRGNYRLLLCGSELAEVQKVVDAVKYSIAAAEVEALDCTLDACWEADIIVLAVPFAEMQEVADRIREVVNQKVVISLANPLDDATDTPATGVVAELQKLLPYTKAVRVSANPFTDAKPKEVIIAGDDEEALETVSELVSTAGFRPVVADAGAPDTASEPEV